MIFQKCKDSQSKINIFEGWSVSLGAQNRPQEAPRGDKKRHRKNKKENQRKKEHQRPQKTSQKVLPNKGTTYRDPNKTWPKKNVK